MAVLAQDAAEFGLVHDLSVGSTTVAVPPLVFGASFLDRWPVREQPGGAHWQETAYDTYSPWVFTLPDAVVHSAAGIVCWRGFVVEETLVHTDPLRHAYVPDGDGIWIVDPVAPALQGTHVSVLSGAGGSYYHAMADGLARLAIIPAAMLHGATGIITTPGRPATVEWLQDRVRDLWRLPLTPVPEHGGLRVERLILAHPNHVACNYHPCVPEWFDGMATLANPGAPSAPRRFFIDRRQSDARPLVEEGAVIAALETCGIEPVTLEFLSADAQIALFRNAELVVAPHGAGLANLLFARPGCRVIELQMDAYCHWCYRRLAALKGLPYDCVVGRAAQPWPDLAGPIHGAAWHVSVPHVVAAVQSVLAAA